MENSFAKTSAIPDAYSVNWPQRASSIGVNEASGGAWNFDNKYWISKGTKQSVEVRQDVLISSGRSKWAKPSPRQGLGYRGQEAERAAASDRRPANNK